MTASQPTMTPHVRPLLSTATEWDDNLQVLVIGSGCAGMMAALRAAHAGARVGVVEKADQLGGTTAAGGGVMWAPANHHMETAGFTDSLQGARDYLAASTSGRLTAEEIDWYVNTSRAATRFLAEHTQVEYQALARPDYRREFPGSTDGGRGLDHQPFNPAKVPGLPDAVRQATYFPQITMAERDALHGAAPDPDLLAERSRTGVRTMGGALISAMAASAWEAGIALSVSTPVTGLKRDTAGWRVTLATPEGEHSLHAETVVIASGGFEWSPQLTQTLLTFPVTPISAPSNEGDGLKLGLSAGAAIAETTAIWGVPVITAHGAEYDGKPSGRMGNVEANLPGSIVVNRQGRRFVNEALNYHDFSRVFANIEPGTDQFANIPAYLVMDSRFTSRYPVAGHPVFTDPADAPPWLIRADTLEELAQRLAIDPSGLTATVERFNHDAEAGIDTQFGRGATEQDRHLGDPSHQPNPNLAALKQAPFYAVELHPGLLGTAGGIHTDLHGRVLDWQDVPLDGLYAAGNCSTTVFKGAYPGGGATIGSAMTKAYAVGTHLASRFSTE